MKIGIFGGTFNPPHIGHERAVKTADHQLGLDLIVIVPTGIPPHKPLPPETPTAEMRYQMAQMAFRDVRRTVISDIEIFKTEPCYTIDTIMSFMHHYPGAELFLLLGTDVYLTLDTWKDCESLLRSATPAVFSRDSAALDRIYEYSTCIQARYGVRTEPIVNEFIEVSSSHLRQMLPRREGVRYINDTIYSYIIKNRLYGVKPNWGWLRKRAYSMLLPSRIPHVAGCEEEALRLAARWDVDLDDAREAAILHDITKKLGVDDNLKIMENHGVAAGRLGFAEEKLLHAKTGAILAQSEFGVSDEVMNAILWHTTGRAEMSMLEKIIYLADYIEPNRDFEGVGQLRALAFECLDAAVRTGLEMSVQDMKARGITPNRTTFDALSDLKV